MACNMVVCGRFRGMDLVVSTRIRRWFCGGRRWTVRAGPGSQNTHGTGVELCSLQGHPLLGLKYILYICLLLAFTGAARKLPSCLYSIPYLLLPLYTFMHSPTFFSISHFSSIQDTFALRAQRM